MRPVPRYRHTQFGAVVVGSLAASALVPAGLGLAFGEPVFLHGGPVMMGIAALLFRNRRNMVALSFRRRADPQAHSTGPDRGG